MRTIICIIFMFMSSNLFAPAHKVLYVARIEPINHFTMDDVKRLLIESEVLHYKIVLSQIRLESGNLTSFLCKNNKNLMGMKFPTRRPTTAVGSEYGYAVYKSYRDCIKDYKLWQKSSYKKGDYYLFLKRVYAEDPKYIIKLKRMV